MANDESDATVMIGYALMALVLGIAGVLLVLYAAGVFS